MEVRIENGFAIVKGIPLRDQTKALLFAAQELARALVPLAVASVQKIEAQKGKVLPDYLL